MTYTVDNCSNCGGTTHNGNCETCNERYSCYRCKRDFSFTYGDGKREYDNNLLLGICGGYGQFTDTTIDILIDPDPDNVKHDGMYVLPYTEHKGYTKNEVCRQCGFKHLLNLCHECAHELMQWLGVPDQEVSSWHSHRSSYHNEHPDHFGWDYQKES